MKTGQMPDPTTPQPKKRPATPRQRRENKVIYDAVWKFNKCIETAINNNEFYGDIKDVPGIASKIVKHFLGNEVINDTELYDRPRKTVTRPRSASPSRKQHEKISPSAQGDTRRSKSQSRIPQPDESPVSYDCKQQLNFDLENYQQAISLMSHDQLEAVLCRTIQANENLNNDINIFQESLKQKDKEFDDMRYTIAMLEKERNAVASHYVICSDCHNYRQLQEEYTFLLKQAHTKYIQLEEKFAASENDKQYLLEKEKSLERMNIDKENIILEIQKRNEDAKVAIVRYKEEEERYKKAREECLQKVTKAECEKDEMNLKLSKIRKEKDELSMRTIRMETEIRDLKKQLSKLEIEKQEENNLKFNNMKSSFKKQLEQARQYTTELCVRITDFEAKDQENKSQIDSLNKKLKMARKDQSELTSKREKHDLDREQKINKKLSAENEHLNETISQLESKFNTEKDVHKNELNQHKLELHRMEKRLQTVQIELDDITAKKKQKEALAAVEQDLLKKEIKNLKEQIMDAEGKSIQSERLSSGNYLYQKELLDRKNEELTKMQRNLTTVQEQLQSSQRECLSLESENSQLQYQLEDLKRQLQESENSYKFIGNKRLSDIEKENETLKEELSETLKSLVKISNEHKDLEKRLEIDKKYLSTKIQQLEKEKQRIESENYNLKDLLGRCQGQVESSDAEKKSFLQEKEKLKEDKEIMRKEIYSLKEKCRNNETNAEQYHSLKIEYEKLQLSKSSVEKELDILQTKYNTEIQIRTNFDNSKSTLSKENDRLRKERNNAISDLERTLREKETFIKSSDIDKSAYKRELEKLKTEKADLITLFKEHEQKCTVRIKELEIANESLQSRFNTEKEVRISTDDTKNKFWEENERLRKERDAANNDLHRYIKQKEETEKILDEERSAYTSELDKFQKEKNKLIAMLKDNQEANKEKVQRLEREIDSLRTRLTGEKANQHNAYEMMQLKNDFNACKLQKENAEKELKELQQENNELETEIENLKSTLQQLENCENKVKQLDRKNQELHDRCRQVEIIIHKKDKENDELRSNMKKEKEEKDNLNCQLEILSREKHELEGKLRTSLECKNCIGLQLQLNKLKDESTEIAKRNNQQKTYGEKLESKIRQLKAEKSSLETDNVTLNQEKNTIKSKLEILQTEKVELEERLRRKSPKVVHEQKSCTKCFEYRNEISNQKREINDLRDRLSEAAGNKLRDNNPNIADLSDMNRPTSLAEKFSSLYTDEYTDAMEVLEDSLDEAGCVRVMLQWLTSCYDLCKTIAVEQRDELKFNAIGFMKKYHHQHVDLVLSDRCLIYVKEFQKKIASESLEAVGQICHMKTVTEESLVRNNFIIKYIKKCTELCWMMQISDPPLYLNFDVKKGENLDKNVFNVFTHSGSKIDYLVWPALYLHTTGPMLAKGVAQGM